MSGSIPHFGEPVPGLTYTDRSASYAVVCHGKRIAVIEWKHHLFLPGGGREAAETPEQTVVREIAEETGYGVMSLKRLGEAIQFFVASDGNYRMHAVFFLAELNEQQERMGEGRLLWEEPEAVAERFYHDCHRWAVALAMERG